MLLPDVIDRVRPTIVQISATVSPRTEDDRRRLGGKPFHSMPLGTGFFVSRSAHILTADHVIQGARQLTADWPESEVHVGAGLALPNSENMRANFQIEAFEVVEEEARHDLALLRLVRNPFIEGLPPMIQIGDESIGAMYGVPALRPDRPRDGEPVAISGYPLGETVLVTNAGTIASSWSITTDELPHPSFPDLTIPAIRDTYLADVQSNPGNSGGPAYSAEDGAIIGILVAGKLTGVIAGGEPAHVGGHSLMADAGLSLLVPIKYGIELFDRHQIEWVAA